MDEKKANEILEGMVWFHHDYIVEVRAKRTMAAPGSYAYDAEAKVANEKDGDVYVQASEYEELEAYTVSWSSLYDLMGDGSQMTSDEKEVFDAEIEKAFVGHPDNAAYIEKLCTDANGSDNAIERYSKFSDTKESKYSKVFHMLSKIIKQMQNGIG